MIDHGQYCGYPHSYNGSTLPPLWTTTFPVVRWRVMTEQVYLANCEGLKGVLREDFDRNRSSPIPKSFLTFGLLLYQVEAGGEGIR